MCINKYPTCANWFVIKQAIKIMLKNLEHGLQKYFPLDDPTSPKTHLHCIVLINTLAKF